MATEHTHPRGSEILTRLQAISTRYAHLYGNKEGMVSMQPFMHDTGSLEFTIEYPKPETRAMQQTYLSLYATANLPVNQIRTLHHYKIQYILHPSAVEEKITRLLDVSLGLLDMEEKKQMRAKLTALVKSSILMADAGAVRTLKEWGGAVPQPDGTYKIHFPPSLSAETKNGAIDHLITALAESNAGRITFPRMDEIKFTLAGPAHIVLPRISNANTYLEDNIPIPVPVPWQGTVEVKKHRALAESYLHALFPHSTVAMKPEQHPTEIIVKPRMKTFDAGMERLTTLLPNRQETSLHEYNGGKTIGIHIHLPPQELMLRIIGSKEAKDQEFIEQKASPSPGGR